MFSWFKPKVDLSLKRLKELHQDIIRLHDISGIAADCELTEVLRELAEIMIHGEKQSESFFEVFLEENVLQDIISIIKQNRSNKIKIQIIQTISILIQNIKNRTSLFFILSNNHVNELITTPLDFMDEDVVSQYISFLKLLSMNLTTDTIQFFYNYTKSADPFPLFSICSKFYDNPEPMVRIAVRTITLNCLKVNDKNIIAYMSQPSTLKYFKKLVYYVISLVVTMNKMIDSGNYSRVGEISNNIIDQLYFLQDVLNIQVECVNSFLKDILMKDFVIAYCFNQLIRSLEGVPVSSPEYLQIRTSLFLLTSIINTFKEPDLQKYIFSLFFPDPNPAHVSESYPMENNRMNISLQRKMSTSTIQLSPKEEDDGPAESIALVNVDVSPETPKEEENTTMLVLESGSEDEEDDITAAGIMNNLALHSVQHRAQLLQPLQPTTSNPTFLSAPSSPTRTTGTTGTTERSFDMLKQQQVENIFLQRFDEADDAERLQLVLVLMSTYHQSVYNSLSEHAQRIAFNKPKSKTTTEDDGITGYYLCHSIYSHSIYSILVNVIRKEDTRFITLQCCVYVLKYLLSNHIYEDFFPFEFFQELVNIMKEREAKVLESLHVFKQLVPSPDAVTYSILSISQQIQTIVGQAFMSTFDYKGILESTSVLLPMEQVTNSLSASIPLFYKLTEVNVSSLNQTQQAFTMQLNNYLLLRRFIFYLIQKKLISIEESSLSSVHSHRRQLTDEAINPSSPIPIMTPVEQSESLYSPEESDFLAHFIGSSVGEQGEDVEYNRMINQPSIRVRQKVEISRVNRYLSCSIVIPASTSQPANPKPVYLSIGRSHLSLLEMVPGSLKDAVVQLVFSLYELLDICVEDNNHRTLSVLIQTDSIMANCEKMVGYTLQNRPGKSVYKLLLQFQTAPNCLEAQRCIMLARNRDMEKRERDIEQFFNKHVN